MDYSVVKVLQKSRLTLTISPDLTPTKAVTSTPIVFDPHLDPDDYYDAFGVPMRLVPAGEFTMGSDTGDDDEKPPHKVYLDAFYMDKYEVTYVFYKACVDAGVCKEPANTNYYNNSSYANYPVAYVNWHKATTYCEWRGAHLPTEAEWEKSSRGTDERTYPWGEKIDCSKTNFCDWNAVVGSYESDKSPYGVYDMAGNVQEWVTDWYSATYYQNASPSIPMGPNFGQYRVLRGGSWNHYDFHSRVSNRNKADPAHYYSFIGFRCAREVESIHYKPPSTTNANITPTPTPPLSTLCTWTEPSHSIFSYKGERFQSILYECHCNDATCYCYPTWVYTGGITEPKWQFYDSRSDVNILVERYSGYCR